MVSLWKLQIKSYFVIAPLKEVVSGLSDFSCKSASNTQTVWYFPDRKKTLEYSFESFSSRERIGNIIWYEIIDFNCKGRKQILHAWKMFLWRANQMHQLNFDNRFPIESKCFLLIALERVTQRFSASGCQRQNWLFIKFNIWCAPPLFEQKFRISPNIALPHSAWQDNQQCSAPE